MRIVCMLVLGATLANAQVDRTFRLQTPATDQDFQDLSVAALTITGVKARAVDAAKRELSISGTSEQMRVADWVVAELDRPGAAGPPSSVFTMDTKEPETTIRVFHPEKIASSQELNEVVTAVRTITDVRYAGIYPSQKAVVLRGTPEQVDAAEWLLAELIKDAPQQTFAFPPINTNGKQMPGVDENQVRVFRYVRARDVQEFNEVQTMIRTLTDARRVYPYVGKRAIAIRGTEEQIDMTRWILAQLDRPLPLAAKSVSSDYTNKAGDVMRMFHFSAAMPVPLFQDTGTKIRSGTGIRRVYPFPAARTLAVRGTAAQVAQATALAAE